MFIPALPEDGEMLLRRVEMYAERAFPEDVVALEFEFDEGHYRVSANLDDATIEAAWSPPAHADQFHPQLVAVAQEFWAPLLGMYVLHWRTMTNHRGYTDAIEMEMTPVAGRFHKRFVRIEATASGLEILEMVAVRSGHLAP